MWRPLITAAFLAFAPAAFAQTTPSGTPPGFDAHGFALAPSDGDLNDYTVTWRAEGYEPLALGLESVLEYANRPLVMIEKSGTSETRYPLVDNLLALNIGAFLAVHKRLGIGLSAPVYLWSVTDQSRGPALGDIRVTLPIWLATLGDSDKGGSLSFSVVPFAVAPSGPSNRYLGDQRFGGGGLVAVSFDKGAFDLSANVGARTHRIVDPTYQNLTGGPNLEAALAAGYGLTDRIALRGEVHFEPYLTSVPSAL